MARKTTDKETDQQQLAEGVEPQLNLAESIAVANGAQGTDIVEYQPHEQAIVEIEKRFANVVFDCSTTAGLDDAKTARKEVRDVRYALQNTTKGVLVPYQDAVKAAQARVNQVKEFGAQLGERVLKVEDPIDEVIKAEEKRQKDEKERLAEIERQRVEKITNKITHYRTVAGAYAARSAADIAEVLERVKVAVILPEEYEEFEAEATIARDAAIEQLETLHKSAAAREESEAQLKKQQEAFEQQQKELEELRRKNQEEQDRRAEEDRQRMAKEQAELDRQRQDLQRQQDEQRQKDEQARRDQEELARLRAQLANPKPTAAPAETTEPAAIATATLATTAHVEPLVTTAVVDEPATEKAADITGTPGAQEIVEVVALGFDVPEDIARQWLRSIQF